MRENLGGRLLSNIFTSGFIKRSFSTFVLIPTVLFLILKGSPYLDILLVVVAGGVIFEWGRVCFQAHRSLARQLQWFFLGMLYCTPAFWIYWRMGRASPLSLIGICMTIWASDIGAYLSGKVFGGPKFAPQISPNKTWSGVLGGFTSALVTGSALIYLLGWNPWMGLTSSSSPSTSCIFFLIVLIAIFSQLGDLLESWVKRRFDLKDTGHLIPGHGGLLDRLDSIIAVGVFLFAVSLYSSNIKIIS